MRNFRPPRHMSHLHKKPTRMASGQPIPLKIESLAWGGKGVGRSGGKVVFVSKSAPGDEGLVRVQKEAKSYSEGVFESLTIPSPFRVVPACPSFPECGGCQWLQVAYEKQLAEKDEMVRSYLRDSIRLAAVAQTVASDPPCGYRSRGEFHAVRAGGLLEFGFFAEGSHRVIPTRSCALFPTKFNEILASARGALQASAFAENIGSLALASSDDGSHFAAGIKLVAGIARSQATSLVDLLGSAGVGGTAIYVPGGAPQEDADFGRPSVSFQLPGSEIGMGRDLTLRASIGSFTQPHFKLNRLLVATVLKWLSQAPAGRVLDLYSGIGNFSLPASFACDEVVAVEESEQASADAVENARENGAANISHLRARSETASRDMAKSGERFDFVILDPPRVGAAGSIEAIAALAPSRIAYVSCNLPTLARDLKAFASAGFELEMVQPLDMFPQTYGVETACLLKKVK